MSILFFKELFIKAKSDVVLTVVTNPASATCTLTYNGESYNSKFATVPNGTVINYSVYHATYGTQTGTIAMDSDKTLTFTGTYTTTSTEKTWSQPTLSSNGTMGGSSFAAAADSENGTSYGAWRAFDGSTNSSTPSWNSRSTAFPHWIAWYNPTAIKVTNIRWTNTPNTTAPKNIVVQGSDNYSSWTNLTSYTNSNNTGGASWSISLSSNTSFYSYYRLYITSRITSGTVIQCHELNITAKYQQTAYTYYWEVTTS